MPRETVTDLNDPRLLPYRDLKRTNKTRDLGIFIAEGHRVARRLLQSDFETVSVFASEKRAHLIADDIPSGVPLLVAPHELAQEIVGYSFHAGVMACGKRKPGPTLGELAANSELLICCADVNDPDNIGTIIRLAASFAADGVLLGPSCPDPFSRRTLRVSMGQSLRIPIVEGIKPADLASLSPSGFTIVAAVLDDAAERLETVNRPHRVCLVLGNEATGLGGEWQQVCDRNWTIEMAPGADSLNVAMAAGIFLFHLNRDRS